MDIIGLDIHRFLQCTSMSKRTMAARPDQNHPRQTMWIQVLAGLVLAVTAISILYQYQKMTELQDEIYEMKAEIVRLHNEATMELREEQVMTVIEEFDATFDFGVDDRIANAQDDDDDDDDVADLLRFQQFGHQARRKRNVGDETPMGQEIVRKAHRHRHRHGHGQPRTDSSLYCMHFALDEEAVKSSQDLPCNELLQREDIKGMELACGVNKLSFWKYQLNQTSPGEQAADGSELIIQEAGVYYIYAQLTFQDEVLNAVYQVRRQSQDGEVEELTECSGLEPFGLTDKHEDETLPNTVFNQCHTERAVRLHPQDRVYIHNMRNTTVIRLQPHLTFWGLFLLQA